LTKLLLKCIINFENMIVCLCHPTSDRELDAIIDDGARTVEEISRRCGAGTGCGACLGELRDRLQSKGSASCARDCAGSNSDLISPDMLASRAR
jgi:bacterioferritin-associated ferredoxin